MEVIKVSIFFFRFILFFFSGNWEREREREREREGEKTLADKELSVELSVPKELGDSLGKFVEYY